LNRVAEQSVSGRCVALPRQTEIECSVCAQSFITLLFIFRNSFIYWSGTACNQGCSATQKASHFKTVSSSF